MMFGGFGDQQAALLDVHVLQVCRLSSNQWLEQLFGKVGAITEQGWGDTK